MKTMTGISEAFLRCGLAIAETKNRLITIICSQTASKDRVYHVPRGKILGGSSGINFMAYGRPCATDIDDWSEKLGISGWTWDDLLPYLKRSQKLEVELPNIKERDVDIFPFEIE